MKLVEKAKLCYDMVEDKTLEEWYNILHPLLFLNYWRAVVCRVVSVMATGLLMLTYRDSC